MTKQQQAQTSPSAAGVGIVPNKLVARYRQAFLFPSETRIGATSDQDLPILITRARELLDNISDWTSEFPRVLLASQAEAEGLDPGRVWQARFVRYFKELGNILGSSDGGSGALDSIVYDLGGYSTRVTALAGLINAAQKALVVPRKADVSYAVSDISFGLNPNTGDKYAISYSVAVLKDWAANSEMWLKTSQRELKTISSKVSRLLR